MRFIELNSREDRRPAGTDSRSDHESGYILVAVIFLTMALLISLAVAAPKMATAIQRDKDLETIHRGEQYKRAIKLYYRQFGRYPTSIDQLVETNNVRFLRKRYIDPETGKDDWKPVYYGQAHVRPLGFFGQPLSAGAGVIAAAAMGTMSGGMYAPDAGTNIKTDANGVPVAADSDSGTTAGPGMSSGGTAGPGMSSGSGTFSMGGQNSAPGSGSGSNSGFGSSSSSGFGSGSSLGSSSFGSNQTGSSPGSPSFGSPVGGTSAGTSSPGMGSSATSFGGSQGPIVGVTLPVNKPSLIDYKKQSRYNKWEFNYDPMEDQMQAAASLFGGSGQTGGMPGTGTGTGTGTGPGMSSSPQPGGSTGIGSNSPDFGFGQSGAGSSNPPSSPTPPTSSPTNPQQ